MLISFMGLGELWQEADLLSEWKQQLERDLETLTAKSNIATIQGVSAFVNLMVSTTW